MIKWTTALFINVIVTMLAIYVVRKVSTKYDIPILKEASQQTM
ncbi:hypothetical protein [Lysinibacillus xylanilyticus]